MEVDGGGHVTSAAAAAIKAHNFNHPLPNPMPSLEVSSTGGAAVVGLSATAACCTDAVAATTAINNSTNTTNQPDPKSTEKAEKAPDPPPTETVPPEPPITVQKSSNVGKYRLLRTVGKGNFAKVKLAIHLATGVEVGVTI